MFICPFVGPLIWTNKKILNLKSYSDVGMIHSRGTDFMDIISMITA